jgi:hypothetical protein
MIIEKVIRLTITKEEQEALEKAERILEEVCDTFGNDCEECPLIRQCAEKGSPRTYLHHCIKALPVED